MKNVAIIGCGKIAQVRHIPEYLDRDDVTLYGLYDMNDERAKELAEKYGAKAFSSIEELLSDPAIDAVSVCAANHAHAEITIQALNAGKDVLCEKPMAVTIDQCEQMVAAAKANNRFLMIGQNQRLAKAHVKAKELIENGTIGTIVTFRTTFGHGGPETWSIDPGKNSWFFDKKKAAMGAMADLGVHKTDLIQYLTGQHVVETTAKISTLDKKDNEGNFIGVDDNAFCIYKMQNGIMGTMTASWTYYGEEDNSTILYGTDGIMKIYDNPDYAIQVIKKDGERYYYDVEKIQTNDNQTKSGIIDLFVDGISGIGEKQISGEEVLAAMRAVFASIESSEKNQTIRIKGNEV